MTFFIPQAGGEPLKVKSEYNSQGCRLALKGPIVFLSITVSEMGKSRCFYQSPTYETKIKNIHVATFDKFVPMISILSLSLVYVYVSVYFSSRVMSWAP